MAGKTAGYVIGGLELVVGALLTATGILSEVGIPLMIAGATTIAGTALSPTPPREKTLRDSPTYGIDRFENPRGSDAMVPILYGEHRVKPAVIAESVSSIAENNVPGVDAQTKQAVKWLGVICEGRIDDVRDVEINDRKALSDPHERVAVATANGTKKDFLLPHGWAYVGDEDHPAIDVYVDGVLKSYSTKSGTVEFAMPTSASVKTFDVTRDLTRERVLVHTIRVYVRGPGRAEFEQLRRVGTYRWTVVKLAPWKARLRFGTRPPAGYTVRVTYSYLGTEGLTIYQTLQGDTHLVFGTAPGNGKKITATYRTAHFHGLKIEWTDGSLDQAPLPGFTDTEQSRNPNEQILVKDSPLQYSTSGREVDDLRIGIVAPNGFIQYGSAGGTDAVLAKVRIRYRKTGTSSWTTLRSGAGDLFGLNAESPSAVRWEVGVRDAWERLFAAGDDAAGASLAAFERAAYDVEVTRTTAKSSDTLVQDDLEFAYVTEVSREGFTYPGTALLAIKALPSAALTGQALRVSCIARRASLYDPRTDDHDGARDIGSSANAAVAIRDLVTSAEGEAVERYGAGAFFSGSDFFLGTDGDPAQQDGWIAFADWCDAWVYRPGDDRTHPAAEGNGERRCRLNVVLDTPQSLSETVGDLAFLSWCFATLEGARWRFPLDQDGTDVFLFVDDVDPAAENMREFVLQVDPWSESPTAVKGTFWNERIDYDRDELLFPVDGLPEAALPNVRDVDLRGCTRETEAARLLQHLAEQARALPHPCSWKSHPGVQHVQAGDVVVCRTRIPYSTGTTATDLKVRVLSVVVGRDDQGKIATRYTGRVMDATSFAINPITVPVTASGVPPAQATPSSVSNLTARVL
jgi:hypothetical protein